jgi:hypothetical protein
MLMFKRHSFQKDLQLLLKNGWILVASNTVQKDGFELNIERAARILRAKLKMQKILDENTKRFIL